MQTGSSQASEVCSGSSPFWTVMPNREGIFPTPHTHIHNTRAHTYKLNAHAHVFFFSTPTHTHTIHKQACTRHKPVPAIVLQKYSASHLAALTWPRLLQIRAWVALSSCKAGRRGS